MKRHFSFFDEWNKKSTADVVQLYMSALTCPFNANTFVFDVLLSMVCIQYHSSLASLNGLEAHLRTISPGAPGAPGPYIFAHFDCIQSTLTSEAPTILLSSFTFSLSSLLALHLFFCIAEISATSVFSSLPVFTFLLE